MSQRMSSMLVSAISPESGDVEEKRRIIRNACCSRCLYDSKESIQFSFPINVLGEDAC